jgi:acyl carrier protein
MLNYIEKVKKLLAQKTGMEVEEITGESSIEEDLNLDEMELVEVLAELEEIYHIDIVEEKEDINTVMDIVDVLVEKVE